MAAFEQGTHAEPSVGNGPGTASARAQRREARVRHNAGGYSVNDTSTATANQEHDGIPLRQLCGMLKPWRWSLTLKGSRCSLGRCVELVPPLLMKQVVDEHLMLGRSDGLLWIAALCTWCRLA